jgi:hypothetical protein
MLFERVNPGQALLGGIGFGGGLRQAKGWQERNQDPRDGSEKLPHDLPRRLLIPGAAHPRPYGSEIAPVIY